MSVQRGDASSDLVSDCQAGLAPTKTAPKRRSRFNFQKADLSLAADSDSVTEGRRDTWGSESEAMDGKNSGVMNNGEPVDLRIS